MYPILSKLEQSGLLSSERIIVEGKIRKYYKITSSGNEILAEAKEKIQELAMEIFSKRWLEMFFNFNNITYVLGPDNARQITVTGSLSKGEVLVIRGPSGVGKSTLLRIIARLQLCIGGEAFLQGESWLHIPGTIWRSSIYYLAQKTVIFDGTVADNLAKPFETHVNSKKKLNVNFAKDKMEELLLPANLWEQDARTLSGGEAARLALLRALLIDPKILLLDEPTAALDDISRDAFFRVLSNWLTTSDERAVILVSHNNDYGILSKISFLDLKAQ